MTSILENELVLKYWGCNHYRGMCVMSICRYERAYNVLHSMEEPIKKGEHYLAIKVDEAIEVSSDYHTPDEDNHFHPWALRLPDRFQPSPKPIKFDTKVCDGCGKGMSAKEANEHPQAGCKPPLRTVFEKCGFCGRAYHGTSCNLEKPAASEKCACRDVCEDTFACSRMTEEECEESVLEDFLLWLITKYRNETSGREGRG